MTKLSTSEIARKRDLEPKALFSELKLAGYIVRQEDKWLLTQLGEKFGGEYINHPKFGRFIVWPHNLLIDHTLSNGQYFSATQIGNMLNLDAKKINLLLSELGWITRSENGWLLTPSGELIGGEPRYHKTTQKMFIVWHDTIIRNKRLNQSVVEFLGQDAHTHSTDKSISQFRQKFEAKHRTLDGHFVRSQGELIIDNWLYMAGVVHAYERQLPIDEDVISDFYLPTGKVYLQYWGSDLGPTDEKKKILTLAIYRKHGFNLIEINPEDIPHLDKILPPLLRKFDIKAY